MDVLNVTVMCFFAGFFWMQDVEVWWTDLCWDFPAFPGKRKRCMQPLYMEVFTTAARLCIIS